MRSESYKRASRFKNETGNIDLIVWLISLSLIVVIDCIGCGLDIMADGCNRTRVPLLIMIVCNEFV